MAELEPGHPDELCQMLTNWLKLAHDPTGSLPDGVTPVEWAVRNFINAWRKPLRSHIDLIQESLTKSLEALNAGNAAAAIFEIECSLSTLAESLRDDLGLHDWNRESE